ncbi:glutamyl-tRNA(Gln) amidotransferase subunit C, chloroplastic/mitochondrial [Herrania umbratica]|uniref:Glutamyl-tRNA(Gln) amidotransferase subunit C, chloroplastic/mitochondrial n=1 Tax=Herrania umbratica TaxID=108875 RepID=A0A6J0ZSN4_9ROSI|nr:glutamyl-tRNA(Gln) amidotransferase subunit C, chloroplastic/mitochondrial [Herrania umbratica]
MGSRALLVLTNFKFKSSSAYSSSKPFYLIKSSPTIRKFSTKTRSSLQPPDVPRLAETARISLAPNEVEEFAPKIRQVIDWFGQLQAVDLDSVEPAIRADTEGDNLREDVPETFENKEALIAYVPSYEEPYIKVPKVLNKE